MPISLAPIGEEVKVVRISGNEKVAKHLRDLGIATDSKLTVLSVESGSVIIRIMDSRLALDHNTARAIFVA